MKKMIVKYILKWLGLDEVPQRLRRLESFEEDTSITIDAIKQDIQDNIRGSGVAKLETIVSGLNKHVDKLENELAGLDKRIEDAVNETVDEVIDDIDIKSKAQDALEHAVAEATLSVRF